MKLSFKFFLWRIKIKTNKLGAEGKAKFLANELIKSIQDCGYSIQNADINKQFGTLNISVHGYGNDDAELKIYNSPMGWSIKTKPNFKMLGIDKDIK